MPPPWCFRPPCAEGMAVVLVVLVLVLMRVVEGGGVVMVVLEFLPSGLGSVATGTPAR